MPDHLRWCARCPPLDDAARGHVAAHVAHWRTRLADYDVLVAPDGSIGIQLWGELVLDSTEPSPDDAPASGPDASIALALVAVAELAALVPGGALHVVSEHFAFDLTATGFVPRPREPDDTLPLTSPPSTWQHATEITPAEPEPDDAWPEIESTVARDQTALSFLLAARLRDRPRDDDAQAFYDHALHALAECHSWQVAPTLVLALEAVVATSYRLDAEWIDNVAAQIVDDVRTRPDAAAIACLTSFAGPIARRLAQIRATEAELWLVGHPYWRVRLAIATSTTAADERRRRVASVWAAIAAAGLPVNDPVLAEVCRTTPRERLLAQAPLPSLELATSSPCADLRRWSLAALGRPAEPVTLLVLSPERRAVLRAAEAQEVSRAERYVTTQL